MKTDSDATYRGARFALEALEPRILFSTIVVSSTADSGAGSLRDAINLSNTMPGADEIHFNIAGPGVKTIAPLSALPTITDSVIINGYTQPGASVNTLTVGNNANLLIELSGANLLGLENGLTISAGNSTVRGLVINNQFKDGIAISTKGGNIIEGNFIGTNASGTIALANADDGISISGVSNNLIGGDTAAARNVISGNLSDGIVVADATFNTISGNYIGINAGGVAAIANQGNGIRLARGSNNTIGGLTTGARNVISGNGSDGIDIRSGFNSVIGNYLGTNAAGTAAIANFVAGVLVIGSVAEPSAGNTIGGSTAGHRNIISGNGSYGIQIEGALSTQTTVQGNYIGTNATGSAAVANLKDGVRITDSAGSLIGGSSAGMGNLLSGNTSDGIEIHGDNNVVQGNRIGTNAGGLASLANGNNGVNILPGNAMDATGNLIGGNTAGQRNIISGNLSDGVEIQDASGNTISGNYIGTNINGNAAIANGGDGIKLNVADANNIGGTNAGQRNVISGNLSNGVEILGNNNHVYGNYIGTNAAGTAALGNGSDGLYIIDDQAEIPAIGSTGNLIGGAAVGQRNVISSNGAGGLRISGTLATGNSIQGNLIGLNAAGIAALPNTSNGIQLIDTVANLIGGSGVNQGNIIANNSSDGIELNGALTSNNMLYGNQITANAANGIRVVGANNNIIGGITPGQANSITANGADGVSIIDKVDPLLILPTQTPNGNSVRGNIIHSNNSLGIDLNGPGPETNDAGDTDTGPNALQNYPLLTTISVLQASTQIDGTINSTPGQIYNLDLYLTADPDANGHGNADAYLGSIQVTTNASGNASFTFTVNAVLAAGDFVSATATSVTTGNTSEFSFALPVIPTVPADLDVDGDVDDADFGIAFAAFTGPGGSSTSPADLDDDGDVDDADFGIAFAAFTGPLTPQAITSSFTSQSPMQASESPSTLSESLTQPSRDTLADRLWLASLGMFKPYDAIKSAPAITQIRLMGDNLNASQLTESLPLESSAQ